jgi:hypothetical protein
MDAAPTGPFRIDRPAYAIHRASLPHGLSSSDRRGTSSAVALSRS